MATTNELLDQAIQLNKAEKYQEVIDLLGDTILTEQNSAELYVEKAISFLKLGDPNKCYELAGKAISINPNNENAYNIRGASLLDKNEYDKAIEDFNKA